MIVYDVSDKKSFGHIKDWLEDINKFTDNNPIKLIVGNKCDLVNEKQVTEEDKKLLNISNILINNIIHNNNIIFL